VKDISGNVSDALDAALEMTFPASDPIAVFIDDYDAWDGATTHVGGGANEHRPGWKGCASRPIVTSVSSTQVE
jgi:hypothetical protein